MNYEKSMYDQPALIEGTKVVVRNLGDGKEYRGTVSGVSFMIAEKVAFYIVLLIDKIEDYDYSNMIVTPACVFLIK